MKINSFLLFLILITFSCKNESEIKPVSFDLFKGLTHRNSELTFYNGYFSKYKEISKGNKTIFEISHYHENVRNANDSGSSIQLYFSFKNDSLKIGKYYFLQNDDTFDTYCLQRGAFIGMRKLYGVTGKFKILSSKNNILKIKIIGEINADHISENEIEEHLIIKDTVLEFREKIEK